MKYLIILCFIILLNDQLNCYITLKSLIYNNEPKQLCSNGCYGLCYNKYLERIQRKRCCRERFCGCCNLKIHVSKYSPLDEMYTALNNLKINQNGEILREFYVKTLTKDIVGNSDEELDILNNVFAS
uniref:Uncharacterized protein n=1 Tax=Strongyloides stercoralis TaxID=6248 RepID=A0A0K0DY57_STRER